LQRDPPVPRHIYKIYAESFKSQTHLNAILSEAQEMVNNARVRPQSFLSGEAGHERELQALAQSCNIREGAKWTADGQALKSRNRRESACSFKLPKSILLVVSASFPIVIDRRRSGLSAASRETTTAETRTSAGAPHCGR